MNVAIGELYVLRAIGPRRNGGSIPHQMWLRVMPGLRPLPLWQITAKVVQQDAQTALFRRLCEVVRRPVLLVDFLLGQGQAFGFDDRTIRKNVALVDNRGGVVVLAGE